MAERSSQGQKRYEELRPGREPRDAAHWARHVEALKVIQPEKGCPSGVMYANDSSSE